MIRSACRPFLFIPLLLLITGCGSSFGLAPAFDYGQSGGAGSAGIHTVSHGETLWELARRYKISLQDIINANNLQAPYELLNGARLTLPPPAMYTVKQGDSLYTISRLFNVSQTQMARTNKLSAPYTLEPGQILQLPAIPARGGRRIEEPAPDPEILEQPTLALRPDSVMSEALAPPPGMAKKIEKSPESVDILKPVSKPEIKSAKIKTAAPARAGGKFAWPVQGQIISSYGPKAGGLHNDGINIKAPQGAPVRVAENGVVVYTGNDLKGFGNLVLVRHADKWVTAYAHLDRTLVKRGDVIQKGSSIGTVGTSGSVDSPQIHFELRRGTEALNPEPYLMKRG